MTLLKRVNDVSVKPHCLGDHVGLPFVLGVCTQQQPYSLVLQFYGSGEDSFTLYKALKQRKLNKTTTAGVFQGICNTLEYIHGKGFLHNDLKSNNVLLELRQHEYYPIIIDFGKSGRLEEMEVQKRSHEA